MHISRRDLFQASAYAAAGLSLAGGPGRSGQANGVQPRSSEKSVCQIGLSQTSLHHTIRAGKLDPLDYPSFVMDTFGIEAIDLVDGAMPPADLRMPFLEKVQARSERAGTNIFMMMVDPILLRSDHVQDRTVEVQRFHRLVDQATVVGAKYLRVRLDAGEGRLDVQAGRAVDGLKRVADYAATKEVSIAVEPGIGSSRNGLWLARVIKQVDHPNCGSLPEFGKFAKFDSYAGIGALMTSASVIAAQSHAFHEQGLELQSDYPKLFQMIVDVGFHGIVTIEYEGEQAEVKGVQATHQLLRQMQRCCTL